MSPITESNPTPLNKAIIVPGFENLGAYHPSFCFLSKIANEGRGWTGIVGSVIRVIFAQVVIYKHMRRPGIFR